MTLNIFILLLEKIHDDEVNQISKEYQKRKEEMNERKMKILIVP
jgi:hypothetical protein